MLIAIVREHGPVKMVAKATSLRDASHDAIRQMLEQWLIAPDTQETGHAFFARVVLEPQAERLARDLASASPGPAGNQCPICHSRPQMAVLRPEGDGGKRMLLCSFCHSEWEFRRVLCPACGEMNHEKLPRYSAEGIAAVRVEACDTCKSYLKSVDLTVDGFAVPEADEVATASLDLWAAERDYCKIHLNVMGF
jgi:FdhE protein